MNKLTMYRKLFKYKVLRHLPGKPGRRYDRKEKRLSAKLLFEKALCHAEGKTCIDLGANIGEYTRKMAGEAKRVIAFEPDPWAYAALQESVADLDNVKIEKAAAGTNEGTVLLYRHADFENDPASKSESSSIISDKENVIEEGAVEVQQVDFIGYLEDLDEDIGLLKMDIEGAEVALLEALFDRPDILKRIDYIVVETHETRIPGHELRVKVLREKARLITRPRTNFHWH